MDLIKNILNDEEKIIQCYKPNKNRYIWITLLKVLLNLLMMLVAYFLFFFVIIFFADGNNINDYPIFFKKTGVYALIACAWFFSWFIY